MEACANVFACKSLNNLITVIDLNNKDMINWCAVIRYFGQFDSINISEQFDIKVSFVSPDLYIYEVPCKV